MGGEEEEEKEIKPAFAHFIEDDADLQKNRLSENSGPGHQV